MDFVNKIENIHAFLVSTEFVQAKTFDFHGVIGIIA